ncbi:TPA: hypothetical protein L5R09_005150 [Pseudomonas aeruginosa]|nr:hypothetical protein [Pseudomonas aeruginosa]
MSAPEAAFFFLAAYTAVNRSFLRRQTVNNFLAAYTAVNSAIFRLG